jgi:hypothetical protein
MEEVMEEKVLKEAFKRWWIAQHKVWPEREVNFQIALSPVGRIKITQLPDFNNPLVCEVFTPENGKKYSGQESAAVISRAINAIMYQFMYAQGPQWNTATMDDYFKKFPESKVLRQTPNLGRLSESVIIQILKGTGNHRYNW